MIFAHDCTRLTTARHDPFYLNGRDVDPRTVFRIQRVARLNNRSAKCAGPTRTARPFAPSPDAPIRTTSRRVVAFNCVACYHQFSVTSGTIFASRKLSFTDLLAAIVICVNGANGVSALQISRDLDMQYKMAFVLSHKLRQAMALEAKGNLLDGVVEVMVPISAATFSRQTARPIALTIARAFRRTASASRLW